MIYLSAALLFPISGCDPEHPRSFDNPPDCELSEQTLDSHLEVCRSCMKTIATAESMYYGDYNTYTEHFPNLRSTGVWMYEAEDILCPECRIQFYLNCSSSEHYTLSCPLPREPNHGCIVDGIPQWPPEPCPDPLMYCRLHMHTIATLEAMYYAEWGIYTDSFDELETTGGLGSTMFCPGCDQQYDLRCPRDQTYILTCPMPSDPIHGSVVEGYTSW